LVSQLVNGSNLRTCPNPWCGQTSAPALLELLRGTYAVVCGDCSLVGPTRGTIGDATLAWNERSTDILLIDIRHHLQHEADLLEALWSWQACEAPHPADLGSASAEAEERQQKWRVLYLRFGKAARALMHSHRANDLMQRLDAELGRRYSKVAVRTAQALDT